MANQWLHDCNLSVKSEFSKFSFHKDIKLLAISQTRDILWEKRKIKEFFVYYELNLKVDHDIDKNNIICTLLNHTPYSTLSTEQTCVRIDGICDNTFLRKTQIQRDCGSEREFITLINVNTPLIKGMRLEWCMEVRSKKINHHYVDLLCEFVNNEQGYIR